MKRFLHGHMAFICSAAVAIMCCGCAADRNEQSNPVQSIDTAMGTIISQTVYADMAKESDDSSDITEEIISIITDLEQDRLSWRLDSSEISGINKSSGDGEGVELSREMAGIIKRCLEVSAASEGAFDITIGETVRLWDIDTWATVKDTSDYFIPEEEMIRECLSHSGYEKLALQGNHLYLPSEVQLDLGAVGKGIALDSVRAYLENREGVTGAVISVGGSILTYGQKDDGSPWRVGVVNPDDTSSNLGYLTLEGEWCVSTSGDYERYVEVDGVRYHHIIDPATGYPADSGIRSVTILTKDGLLSDALSTACFILGTERGNELVQQFDAEALFVDSEGNISMTDGMEAYFYLSR